MLQLTYAAGLKHGFFFYCNELYNCEFFYDNPLFWALIFLLFIFFMGMWSFRKTLFFFVILTALLLLATKLGVATVDVLCIRTGPLAPPLINLTAVMIITVLFVAFAFLK